MKLGTILEVCDENTNVSVMNSENPDELVAWYDGKNSIPKGLNPCEVVKIRPQFDTLYVYI